MDPDELVQDHRETKVAQAGLTKVQLSTGLKLRMSDESIKQLRYGQNLMPINPDGHFYSQLVRAKPVTAKPTIVKPATASTAPNAQIQPWATPGRTSSNTAWQIANQSINTKMLEPKPYSLYQPALGDAKMPPELAELVGDYQAAGYKLLDWLIKGAGFSGGVVQGQIKSLSVHKRDDVIIKYIPSNEKNGVRTTIPYITTHSYRLIASRTKCKVPADVLHALEEDIFGRIAVHKWHKDLPEGDRRIEDNDKHEHHINLLFDVLTKLGDNDLLS
ncbi:hypothetical protein Q7P37_010806 [Cladosporium fusiforme]